MTLENAAVPPSVRALLDRLAQAGIFRQFYLGGGTGLALLLAHRRSMDLDFFSRANRLGAAERRQLSRALASRTKWAVLEDKDGTMHGLAGRVKMSFFWYPQPLVKPLVRVGMIRVASLEDIGLMKVGAIIGRGSRKDFVDLYTLCRRIPLERLLTMGRKKFRNARDFTLQALKALSYFEDAEKEPPVVSLQPVAWIDIQSFFAGEAVRLARRYLSQPINR